MSAIELRDLHDSRLVGITYRSGGVIDLTLTKTEQTNAVLTFSGVAHFFCTGLLEGNIVQSIEIVEPNDVRREEVEYFIVREGRGQTADRLHEQIRARQLLMVLLAPSYGAELGCLCDRLERN